MRRIADGNVKFISRDDSKPWIMEFPPELMTGDGDFDRSERLRSVLNGVDHTGSCKEEDNNDQNWNHGPRNFYLVAAVYLRRFAAVLAATPAIFCDRVCHEAKNDQENQPCNGQDQQR